MCYCRNLRDEGHGGGGSREELWVFGVFFAFYFSFYFSLEEVINCSASRNSLRLNIA